MNRKWIVALLFLSGITVEAQYNRGMNFQRGQTMQQRGPASSQQPRLPEIDIEKAVGMTFYDFSKVSKKIGVKEKTVLYGQVESVLKVFNDDLRQIKRINTFLFSEGKSKIENARKETIKNKDYSIFREINKKVTESLKPVIEVIKSKEVELDKRLKESLTQKQMKKWIKYKEKLKKR